MADGLASISGEGGCRDKQGHFRLLRITRPTVGAGRSSQDDPKPPFIAKDCQRPSASNLRESRSRHLRRQQGRAHQLTA
jgi:hypothetical protein